MRRALLLAALALAAARCGSPAAPDISPTVILGRTYQYACGSWNPGPPPLSRALMDVGVAGADAPDPESVAALEAAGAETVYRFHGGLVRVVMDVAEVPRLYGLGAGTIFYATTVSNPGLHDVRVGVVLDRHATADDLQALWDLGATWARGYDFSSSIAAIIDDSRLPDVRALPHVVDAYIDGPVGCVLNAATRDAR